MAFSDDFTTSLDARWTTFGPGTIDSNATFASMLTIVGASQSTYESSGVYAAASTPLVFTADLASFNYQVQSYHDHLAGIFVMSSGGAMMVFGLGNYSNTEMAIRAMKWTDDHTFSANRGNTPLSTGYGLHAPMAFRITAATSSAISCEFAFSRQGEDRLWMPLDLTNADPGFTIARVGVFLQPSNQSKAVSACFGLAELS